MPGNLPPHYGLSPLLQNLRAKNQRYLARDLTAEEESEVKYAFELLDKDNQRVLSYRHLKVALRAFGFPVSKADVAHMLRDQGLTLADGLNYRTWRELIASKIKNRTPEEEVHRAFQLFDLDGAGYITTRDLALIAKQTEFSIEPAEIQDMVAEFDRDGDGVISLDEFAAILSAYDG